MKTRVELFAENLDPSTVANVRKASSEKVGGRVAALPRVFASPDDARTAASATKQYVLDNLKGLLLLFEERCTANGIKVHWAFDAESANRQILEICQNIKPGATIVKGKSMATEEIHLNDHLEGAGYEVVETDLGEFVVQLDHDKPSHIVMPIMHKSRLEVAESFRREGLGPYTEVAEQLTMQARARLREKFRAAEIGISGVNFGIAATGRLVIVENEGNNRLSTTAPRIHIALMGIEKLLPREADLALFLPMLAGSATGQRITTYTHFISGPRKSEEPDGPEEVHVVLLDNGRSRVLKGRYREILKCIRCGACLNVCPVYRQSTGHAYGHVYSGPLGAVLAPALEGVQAMGDLAKASTLCGACEEVCPVRIPIPHMLLELRDEAFRAEVAKDGIPWRDYAFMTERPRFWRAGLLLLPMAERAPNKWARAWAEYRGLPTRRGQNFRSWWRGRS